MDLLLPVLVLGIVIITLHPHHANGSTRTIIRHCCDIGKQWYIHSDQSCPIHPMIDNARDKHTPCLLAVEVCCTAEMRKQRCLTGKKSALQGETNFEVNEDAKECYSCCRLGMKANMDLRGCQKLPRSHLFTSQCRQTFTQCCSQESSNNITHPSNEPDISSESCGNNGLHCSIFEKCVPHKRRGFVCVPINGEEVQHKIDSRTTVHKTSFLDATTLFEDGKYCQNGYIFNRNKMLCEDINECIEQPRACDPSHTCQNEPGSYKCLPGLHDTINEIPKPHRHRHADGPIRHWTAVKTTTSRHRNIFFQPPSTLHARFDANDESVASIDRPNSSSSEDERDFFVEVNNFEVETIRDEVGMKDSRSSRAGDGNVFDPIRKKDGRCKDGRRYNDISKECEEQKIECEGHTCHKNKNMICGVKLGKEFCTCEPGFRYNPRTDSCDDLNECMDANHGCRRDERCHNTHGSYVCLSLLGSCPRGYRYDGMALRCSDVDECSSHLHNCTPSQTCSNLPGSFICNTPSCPPGMIPDEQNRCLPATNKDCNVDLSVCPPNEICTAIGGRYSCRRDPVSCGIGFKLDADVNECQDVDECKEETHNCTGHHMFCSNLIGQFKCECTHGFNYDARTHSCEDVDECLLPHSCPSDARCRNMPGSFTCSCRLGFQIRNDFRHCIDINECTTGIHSCEQECSNTLGSYYCSCQEGFKLNDDGFTCSDLNECTSNNNNECQSNNDEICVNTWGGHHCHPVSCPAGFVRSADVNKHRKPSHGRDHKQIFLSLAHPSVHKPIASSFSYPIVQSRIYRRHKRSPDRSWQFNSGRINFPSEGELLDHNPSSGGLPIVLTIGESADVVCQRTPCPQTGSWCPKNSTTSIQWHQLLVPSRELNPHSPIVSIKQTQKGSLSSGSLFQIVGGNENSLFEVRVDSTGIGHIHVLRDLKTPESYEIVVSVKILSGQTFDEHVMNIIISTAP